MCVYVPPTRHLIKYPANGNACNPLDPSYAILFGFQSQIENQMLAHRSLEFRYVPQSILVSFTFCLYLFRQTHWMCVCVCALSSEIGITLEKSKYHSQTGVQQSHSEHWYPKPYTLVALCTRGRSFTESIKTVVMGKLAYRYRQRASRSGSMFVKSANKLE